MKFLFNYVIILWNKFINLFKKKEMQIESDIIDLINTHIQSHHLLYKNITNRAAVSANFNKIGTNSFEVIIDFSIAKSFKIQTQLTFSNKDKIYALDITDGILTTKNIEVALRNVILHEIDILNISLHSQYEVVFKKYHP